MWNSDDDEYGCDPQISVPTDNELLREQEVPAIEDTLNFISLALGPPVYVGRGIRASTLEAMRTTSRGPTGRRLEKPETITAMMRRMGLNMVNDTNLSSKTTRRMPSVEPVIPGLVPLVNDESYFKMTPTNLGEEQVVEPTPQGENLDSTISSDISSISYRTLESDSSYYSDTSAISYNEFGLADSSSDEEVYSSRELCI